MTAINERVEVYTVFGRSQTVRPVKFRWRNRVVAIAEITYTWASAEGATRFMHFAVHDKADLFELVFNTTGLTWELRAVEPMERWPVRRCGGASALMGQRAYGAVATHTNVSEAP